MEGRLAQPIIKSNWIYNKDAEGILLTDPNQNTIICNNTIVSNGGGIYLETGDERDSFGEAADAITLKIPHFFLLTA